MNLGQQTKAVIALLKSLERLKCKHQVPHLSHPQQNPSMWWLNVSAMQQYGILISHPGCIVPGAPDTAETPTAGGPGWVASRAQINSLRAECWGSRQILQGQRWPRDEPAGSEMGGKSRLLAFILADATNLTSVVGALDRSPPSTSLVSVLLFFNSVFSFTLL